MIVDSILQARVAGRIGAGLAFEYDGGPVRQNQAGPDQKNARLTERNLTVVDADEARALGNQQRSARRRVVDIFGHLRGDLTRQIRPHASDKCGRNDGPSLNDIGRCRTGEPVRRRRPAVNRCIDEGEFAILPVLNRGFVRRWQAAVVCTEPR